MSGSIVLDESQQQACALIESAPFGVVTGGPGTGKTTTLKTALDALKVAGVSFRLAAPTGKAAKRLAEVTGYEASTVHRLLEYGPGGFARGADFPLDAQLVVVDEASMLDVELGASLMSAIDSSHTRLILVGDADQLPSVGPGRVFGDLIDSGVVPVARLTTLHRAAAERWVARSAPEVLAGRVPGLDSCADFEWTTVERATDIADAVSGWVADELPRRDAVEAQVLSPQNTGAAGVEALNERLQDDLNPARKGEPTFGKLRVHDRVIQTKNDYTRGVFNGEVGKVIDIDKGTVKVSFDDRVVDFDFDAAGRLRLAYALTVHRCVAGDTLIQTDKGLQYARELEESSGTVEGPDGIARFDGLVRNSPGKLLRIHCERGYEVSVTPEHGLMAWDGERYTRLNAEELRAGQWLRLRVGFDGHGEKRAALPPLGERDVRAHVISAPERVTSRVAEWLGLMVADGTVFQRGVRLSKRHADVVDRFANLSEEMFRKAPKRFESGGLHVAEVYSTILSDWCLQVGGLAPNQKAVPACIRASGPSVQGAFLRGLFEDGSVNLKKGRVDHAEWSTCYEEMSRVVQVMLLRLGIQCSRSRYRGQWRISVYPDGLDNFAKKVGFVSSFKRDRLSLGWPDGRARLRIPVSHSEVGSSKMGWRRNARNRGYVSRQTADREPIGADRLPFLHVRIESIEPETGPTYCLRVPGTHRFLQSGFDGFNSQGSEYEWCVCVVHSTHTRMLTRQLLYTAITRAKKGVVIVGDRVGIERAVKNTKDVRRRTSLIERLTASEEEAA